MNKIVTTFPHDIATICRLMAAHRPDTRLSETAARQAAVAMVLRESQAGTIEMLLIQRVEHPLDPWSGHMAFPGGRRDPQDHSLEAVAVRETLEEVGIRLEHSHVLGRLDDVTSSRLLVIDMSVSAFVFLIDDTPTIIPNTEVADIVWAPLDVLGDSAHWSAYRFPLDPEGRGYPSIQYGQYTIWGLTYRMIANFMSICGVALPEEMSA